MPELSTFEWQKPVKDIGVRVPYPFPMVGDRYILGNNPLGVWSGHSNDIVYYWSNAWHFIVKSEGMICYIMSKHKFYYWNGSAWKNLSSVV